MKSSEMYISKIIFKNRILMNNGQQFENLFVDVMTKKNPNFKPVKAYGSLGDQKNDGFDRNTGTYYQIFAPEDITKNKTIYEATNKLENDFKGLFKNWNDICPIKNYFFVINDKFLGIPPTIMKKAIKLDSDYPNVNINVFTTENLVEAFSMLDECQIQDIIGFVPNDEIPIIGYDALYETVSYLLSTELLNDFGENLVVPDFDKKIEFNGLSEIVKSQLVNGSYQESILNVFFNNNPGYKEILQKKFHTIYRQSVETIPDTNENFSDSRFYYILENSCSKNILPIRSCVVVLMAYYFSSCDIFEKPIT